MSDEKDLKNNEINEIEEDIEIDASDGSLAEDNHPDMAAILKKLKEKLRICQAEKEDYLSGWQRSKADFINAKKINEVERASLVELVSLNIFRDILPILDSFDIALAESKRNKETSSAWLEGVFSIYSNLLDILAKKGLKAIGAVGEKFNIEEQEPVALDNVTEKNLDDTVTEVLQKGYKLNDKVLRPSKVKVGKFISQN